MLAIHFSARTDSLNLTGRFAHSRCAIAGPMARCTWINRRRIRSARRHNRCAANILGCGHPLSSVRTKVADLLGLSAEVHRPCPASRFAVVARTTVAGLPDLVESGLERARDRPDDGLGNIGGLKSVAERETDRSARYAGRDVGDRYAHDHEDD